MSRELLTEVAEMMRSNGVGWTPKKYADLLSKIESELAKPKPKPVAYLRDDGFGDLEFTSSDDGFAVYTAPPARKPLSEDELRKCFKNTNITEPLSEGWPGLERFARAIEKAHGIE